MYYSWLQDPITLQLTRTDEPVTLDDCMQLQQQYIIDDTIETCIIQLKNSTRQCIGDVNIFMHAYLEPYTCEIDVMIGDIQYRKNGYGAEACKLMMQYGIQQHNLHTFIAKIASNNIGSIQLFRKLGFNEIEYVGVFDEYIYEYRVK